MNFNPWLRIKMAPSGGFMRYCKVSSSGVKDSAKEMRTNCFFVASCM